MFKTSTSNLINTRLAAQNGVIYYTYCHIFFHLRRLHQLFLLYDTVSLFLVLNNFRLLKSDVPSALKTRLFQQLLFIFLKLSWVVQRNCFFFFFFLNTVLIKWTKYHSKPFHKKSCYLSQFSNIYFSCQAAVKKRCLPSWAKFSSIYFSCLAALTNPNVYLSWAKFSSSLVDISRSVITSGS